MPNDLSTYYLTQGVLGVTVVALAVVAIILARHIVQLYKEQKADAEARRVEDKATLEKVSGILEANTQSNLILAEKIEAGKTRRRT